MSYDTTAGRIELADCISDSAKRENLAIANTDVDWMFLVNRQMIFDALDFDTTYGFLTTAQRSNLESSAKAVVNLTQYL